MAAGTSALLMVIGGGAAGVAALTRHRAEPRFVTAVGDAAAAGAAPEQTAPALQTAKAQIGADAASSRTAAEADRTATRTPIAGAASSPQGAPRAEASDPAVAPAAQPVINTRTVTQTREIPYSTRTVRDPSLPLGTRQVQSPGVAGERTLRYLVTLIDGRPTGRRLLGSTVTRPPEQEVVALGEQADDQQSDDQQSRSQQSGAGRPAGGWHGHGRGGHCRATFDFCVPLSRDAACSNGYGRRLEDAGAVQVGGQVGVTDADLDVLSGRGC